MLLSTVNLAYAKNETNHSSLVDNVNHNNEISRSDIGNRFTNIFRENFSINETVNEVNDSQSIDNQINESKIQLTRIKEQLKKQDELININGLLNKLTKLENQTLKISKASDTSIVVSSEISKQITEAVKLTYHISKAKQVHENYLNKIRNETNELDMVEQRLTAIQQLLINPINKSNSQISNHKVNELIATTENLQAQLTLTITQESQLIAKAKQAISSLESLQETLIQHLEKKTEDSDLPASNTDQIKQKIVTNEIALAQLRAELAKDKNQKSLPELQKLQTTILIKQHELWLYNLDNEILQSIQPLTASLPIGQSFSTTEDELNNAYDKAVQVSELIDEKIETVTVRQKTLKDYTDVIGQQPELSDAYKQRLDNLKFLKLQINALQTRYDQRLTKNNANDLFARKKVFKDTNFSTHITSIPESLLKISYQVKISFKQFFDKIAQNPWQILTVLAIMTLIAFLFRRLSHFEYGRELFKTNKDISLVVALRKAALVLKKHKFIAILFLFIAMIIHFIGLPPPSYHITMLIVAVVFSMILWFSINHLDCTLGVVTKRDALQSNISIIFLALCTLLYGLSSLSAVLQPLVDFYERLLMFSLAIFAWSSQRYINSLLKHTDKEKNLPKSKTYFSYIMFVTILPSILIIISLIGLIGYTQLSWLSLSYAIGLLIMFTMFTLGILLINSIRKQLKLASIKRYEHGVFFAQDLINPISLLVKTLWFIVCVIILLFLVSMGHVDKLIFITEVLQWFFKPLFKLNETSFSLFSTFMMVASPFIIYRIGKWLRTFSFHWLFSKVNDFGIRHSLSIFSQYVAILVGVLITLKIVGLDLTSFAVFAGALGVGVGLGLQDIAKNFISGILLLIERPLRQGDWVMIDGNEGFVKSIGLRAVILENFDKQEVIIPNGNAVNNSLTNFTHSNKLNRTVLYIGVSYDCEPDKIHQLIDKVLTENESVLDDPGWDIVLWEYASSAINYRIQYHINLNHSQSFATKNAILKRIWYVFKEEGVEIPYPQRDVYIKNRNSHNPVTFNSPDIDEIK